MKGSIHKSKKPIVFSAKITLGDILQILVMILSISVAVKIAAIGMEDKFRKQTEEIDTKLRDLFPPPPVVLLRKGEAYYFDDDLSSLKIVDIDPEKGEVEVHLNIRGDIKNEALITNKTRIIPVPNGTEYSFILTDVDVSEGYETAKFVIAKVKE